MWNWGLKIGIQFQNELSKLYFLPNFSAETIFKCKIWTEALKKLRKHLMQRALIRIPNKIQNQKTVFRWTNLEFQKLLAVFKNALLRPLICKMAWCLTDSSRQKCQPNCSQFQSNSKCSFIRRNRSWEKQHTPPSSNIAMKITFLYFHRKKPKKMAKIRSKYFKWPLKTVKSKSIKLRHKSLKNRFSFNSLKFWEKLKVLGTMQQCSTTLWLICKRLQIS